MADGSAACICVLFYGSDDYCFNLARRVLNEPMRRLAEQYDIDFRFALNDVGARTKQFVLWQSSLFFPSAVIFESPTASLKYPVMRKLLAHRPIAAPFVIWFDDDSCLAPDNDPEKWFLRISAQMASCAVAGSVRRARLVGNQVQWIKAQDWYNGKEPQPYVTFVSGSWWAASTDVLLRFDWPPENLRQRGGDVMFGELCRQHDLAIAHFRDGVWINANDAGLEAAAPRRKSDEQPVGSDYVACK
jgi:hypothetical protein